MGVRKTALLYKEPAVAADLQASTYETFFQPSFTGGDSSDAAIDIGTAYSSRRVFLLITNRFGLGETLNGGSIGGESVTVHQATDVFSAQDSCVYAVSAVVSAGDTGTVVLNFSAGPASDTHCFVFTVDDNRISGSPIITNAEVSSGTSITPADFSATAGVPIFAASSAPGNVTSSEAISADDTFTQQEGNNKRGMAFHALSPASSDPTYSTSMSWTTSADRALTLVTWAAA
jgi:hypothetical protein